MTSFPGGFARDILINPDDCATAYVADHSEVYATHDSGATWRRITGNLADVPVIWRDLNSLEFVPSGGPLGAAAVLVAGRGGVHAMYTAEESVWLAVNEGLPNAPAADWTTTQQTTCSSSRRSAAAHGACSVDRRSSARSRTWRWKSAMAKSL